MNLDAMIQQFQKSKSLEELSNVARLMSMSLALASPEEQHELLSSTQRQAWIHSMLSIAEYDNLEILAAETIHIMESFVHLEELAKNPESHEMAEGFALEELTVLDLAWVVRTFLAQYLRAEKVAPCRDSLPVDLSWIRTSSAIARLESVPADIASKVRSHPWWAWILENGLEDMVDPVHFTKEQKGES